MKTFCAVVFVCLLHGAVSQIIRNGTCPTGLVADDRYDNAEAAGFWYIAEQIPWPATKGLTCPVVMDEYAPNFNVTLEGVSEATGEKVSTQFPASILGKGVYSLTIMGIEIEMIALSADLEKYITYFSCMNIDNGQSMQFVWIFTKEAVPCEETLTAARAVLSKVGVSTSDLETFNHQNCQ